MKKIFLYVFVHVFLITCTNIEDTSSSPKIPISAKNQTAIEFYMKAELKKSRGDIVSAISDYKTALRIEPTFFMAAINIPISDKFLKTNYIKNATAVIENLTPSERLIFEIFNSQSIEKKRKFGEKLVELNPNSSEAKFILASLYTIGFGYIEKKGLEILNDIIESDPKFYNAHRSIFNSQYSSFDWRKQKEIAKNKDSLSLLETRIDNLISLDTLNPAIYRQFGDVYRGIDPNKTKEFYLKGLDICNSQGNSFRSELILSVAYANFLLGKEGQMFEYLQEAIDVEFEPFLKIKRIFQFVNICVGIENYDRGIAKLNSLESDLIQFGLNDKNINQFLVSIYYFKSIIYALMEDDVNSMISLKNYLSASKKVLVDIPNLDYTYVEERNRQLSGIGIIGGLDDRLFMATELNQHRNSIFINILNGKFDDAKKIIDEPKINKLSAREKIFYDDLTSFKMGRYNEVIKSRLDNQNLIENEQFNGFFNMWHTSIYGLSLHRNGDITKAKDLFYGMANSTGFNFNGLIFKQRAKNIYFSN